MGELLPRVVNICQSYIYKFIPYLSFIVLGFWILEFRFKVFCLS